jgi:hypothetical protein
VQPALGQAGGELRLAVLPVVQPADVGGGDGDERGVPGEGLVQANLVQLAAQRAGRAGARRSGQR